MSNMRRSRTRQNIGGDHGNSSSKSISDEEIKDLISNLQGLLPPASHHKVVSSGRVLQETCDYIRSLQKQVDDLSETLSDLLHNADSAQAAALIITTLLLQE